MKTTLTSHNLAARRRPAITLAALSVALALAPSDLLTARAADPSGPPSLPNPFFAMDTGMRDAQHQTPESQAELLQELGYPGIGASVGQVPAILPALDRHGLKLFTVYIGFELETAGGKVPAQLQETIATLKGRPTIIWLYLTSKKYKPSAEAGDEEAVPLLRQIADLAKESGLKVALYPHTWFWVERVGDAVRVAKKVERDNLGVTFNLCHSLRVGEEKRIPELLAAAAPHLFVVSLNGADHEGDWDRLIQPLDRGAVDLLPLLRQLRELRYAGPIGLQLYGVKGEARDNLKRSLAAWRRLAAQAAQ